MHPPGRYPAAHIGQLPRGHRRQEAGVCLLLLLVVGLTGTKRVPAERERHLVIVSATSAVLAVHDPRLVGMQLQPDLGEPTTDRLPHLAGLTLSHAMDHRIIREAFESDPRELPDHPHVEAVM